MAAGGLRSSRAVERLGCRDLSVAAAIRASMFDRWASNVAVGLVDERRGAPPIRGGGQDFTNFNLDPGLDEIVKTRKVMVTVIVTHVSVTGMT